VTRLKIRGSLGPLLIHLHDVLLMHKNSSTTRLAIDHSTIHWVFDSFCMNIRICLMHCIFSCQRL